MSPDERHRKISIYGSGYDMLKNAMDRYPREMWHYRPTPEEFSIHEILLHVTDSEANSFVRARHLIAQPGSTVSSYDEMRWSKTLDYHHQSPDDAVELFRWLRGNTYKLIRDVPPDVWAHTIRHPQNGEMTMDDWLDTYMRHVPEHVAQMESVYQSWLSSR